MNFRFYFYPVVFSILGIAIISCNSSKNTTADHLETKEGPFVLENSLLWEISGNGLANSSYLFGTIHVINEEDYFLPDGTLSALDQSNKVVFEINMEEMTDLSKQMSLLKDAFMKDGLSLQDLLTDDEYNMVKAHFEKMGIPIFLFERLKPMFLTVFASGDMNPMDFQSGNIKSYEMEFMDIASRTNMDIGGLETIEFQMSVFDSIPYTDQARMLVESIKFSDTDGDQFKQAVEVYKSQDLNAMQKMFAAEEGGLEGYEDLLLVNRNKNWIPIMAQMMKPGSVFFAVGAGHLGGEKGVIHLLRSEGYEVKPYRVRKI